MEFPFNIFTTAEANDFEFSMQFGFAKPYNKITNRGKSTRGHGLGELRKFLGSPFNISATAEASNFKCDA